MTVASGAESFLNGGKAQEGSQTEEASTLGDSIEDNEMQVTKETSVGASTMADSSLGISDDESTFSSIKKGAQDGANGKSNPISPIQAEKILEPPKTVRTSGGLAEGLDRAGTTSATPKIRNLTSNISGRVTRGGGIAPSGVNTETGGKNRPMAIPIPTGAASSVTALDKPILLKMGNPRMHIHCYDLWIKIKATNGEEEEQVAIQHSLQKFFEIVSQVDKTTIIPPYLELDRNDRTIPDISGAFSISLLEVFSSVRCYFSRLSQRDDKGNMILAQSITFQEFMELARALLINMDYILFSKASDQENAAEIGWMLYSTRSQDEEQLAELFSALVQESIGVKWRPIRINDRFCKDALDGDRTYALHLEASTKKAAAIRQKLAQWYGSGNPHFQMKERCAWSHHSR